METQDLIKIKILSNTNINLKIILLPKILKCKKIINVKSNKSKNYRKHSHLILNNLKTIVIINKKIVTIFFFNKIN